MTALAAAPYRRESRYDRRAAIAVAARQLIVEKGMAGLRTRDIAERVGINIATLHYHVPTKAELVQLVVQSVIEDLKRQTAARPRDGLGAMHRLALNFQDFEIMFVEGPDIGPLMIEFLNLRRRDADTRAAIDPMMEYWWRMIAQILADGVAEGCFRADLDPRAGAEAVVGALLGFLHHPLPSGPAFRRLTDELVRSIKP